jgi:hypothetical protein
LAVVAWPNLGNLMAGACPGRAALLPKGVRHAQLARANLSLAGQSYVGFDGKELRACRDAAAAIGAVVRAKRPCSAVDLSAIRTAASESAE